MAQILVPGVAQAVVSGTVGGHPWASIWHYKKSIAGQNWPAGDLNTLAETIMANLKTLIAPKTSDDVTFGAVTTVDIGVTNPFTGNNATAAFQGTAGVSSPPPSTCILVSFQTLSRYRGGHPRAYMPPSAATNLNANEDQWNTAFIDSYSTSFGDVQDAVFAAGLNCIQVAVRYTWTYTADDIHHKFIKTRGEPVQTPQVVNWIAKAGVGTQRRRVRIGG